MKRNFLMVFLFFYTSAILSLPIKKVPEWVMEIVFNGSKSRLMTEEILKGLIQSNSHEPLYRNFVFFYIIPSYPELLEKILVNPKNDFQLRNQTLGFYSFSVDLLQLPPQKFLKNILAYLKHLPEIPKVQKEEAIELSFQSLAWGIRVFPLKGDRLLNTTENQLKVILTMKEFLELCVENGFLRENFSFFKKIFETLEEKITHQNKIVNQTFLEQTIKKMTLQGISDWKEEIIQGVFIKILKSILEEIRK